MKNDTRKKLAIVTMVVLTFFAASCGDSKSAEITRSPTTNLEQSVQLTLTNAAPVASGETKATAVPEVEVTAVTTEADNAECDLQLPTDKDWPVVLCETFDDNTKGWQIESQDNDKARYNIEIQNGRYELDYNAKVFAGFQRSALTWFDVASAKDFALSVTTMMNSDFQGVSWGLAFRAEKIDNTDIPSSFFLFSIYNDNTYVFEIYEDNGWIPLISQRAFGGIRPNEENKLTVVAEGGDFTFYINDELVNTFSGGLLQEDGILLIVSAKEGVNADYYFDNLVLQTSPQN